MMRLLAVVLVLTASVAAAAAQPATREVVVLTSFPVPALYARASKGYPNPFAMKPSGTRSCGRRGA